MVTDLHSTILITGAVGSIDHFAPAARPGRDARSGCWTRFRLRPRAEMRVVGDYPGTWPRISPFGMRNHPSSAAGRLAHRRDVQ
jgi:hypothetical protein